MPTRQSGVAPALSESNRPHPSPSTHPSAYVPAGTTSITYLGELETLRALQGFRRGACMVPKAATR